MLLTAAVISIYIGDEPVDREPLLFLHTMTTSFVVLAAISLAALLLSLKRHRIGVNQSFMRCSR